MFRRAGVAAPVAIAVAMALALGMAPSTVVPHFFSAQPALAAKGGNGNGNGRGNGFEGSPGNSAKTDSNAAAAVHGHGASKATTSRSAAGSGNLFAAFFGRLFGRSHAQEVKEQQNLHALMGALNAVHASEHAFDNAGLNSRVGLLAAYVEGKAASGADVATLHAEIDALRAELAALDSDPNATPAQKSPIVEELALKEAALAVLEAHLLNLLEAAANKPVTLEVQAEVDRMLTAKGIFLP